MKLTIDTTTYSFGKLNALAQFHVLRRLAPVIASVGLSIPALQAMKGEDFTVLLGPVSEILAKMPDEEADYVLFTCLAVVSREQDGGRYAAITAGKKLMFEDIDMVLMLRLVVEVIKFNYGGFLKGPGAESASLGS